MNVLNGKVAIITGGALGMGRASALLFAKEGAKVVVVDINDQMGAETEKQAREFGGAVQYIHADVGKVTELERMARETVKAFGKINIFWHNAGNVGPGLLERTSEEDFDRTIAIHVKGGFFGSKYCIPEIVKAGGGSILFTSSIAGLKPSRASATYSIGKSSLVMLAKCLALAYAKDNIRVNCICPGGVETPLQPHFFTRDPDVIPPEVYASKMMDTIPVRRLGTPEEIANTALFLVSDAASYITGAILSVDGGASCT